MSPKKPRDTAPKLGIGYDTDLRRRKPSREPWSLVIVTNGKCAERRYFEAVRDLSWVKPTTVRVLFQAGDPRAVLQRADSLLSDGGCDEAWAVCDVDAYGGQLADVARRARLAGVGLALSNPCFEVWLILHHGRCARYFDDADQVQQHLKRLDPRWDKLRPDFTAYLPRVLDATTHARQDADPLADNPSTSVWQLIESMNTNRTDTSLPRVSNDG